MEEPIVIALADHVCANEAHPHPSPHRACLHCCITITQTIVTHAYFA